MFIWLIPNLLGKAAYSDVLPPIISLSSASSGHIIVAAEYKDASYFLIDEPVLTENQRLAFGCAVSHGLDYISRNKPVVFVCQQGRSRSVTAMCTVAAIYEHKKFSEELKAARRIDPDIQEQSPILVIAKQSYPEIF